MTRAARSDRRAHSLEEIKPLLDMCKAGKLFDVQGWVAARKPVDLPLGLSRASRTPLHIAIDLGFHSLVQVLLEGGADPGGDGWKTPMYHALEKRRFDIVQLLVEHGFDPTTVNMKTVFATWDPAIMEYFIDQGADVETGNPLAHAFCERIRTALRVYKKYPERFPSFPEQANIALRHHCKEGNLKWVSLMLWAGADPYAPGTEHCDEELDATCRGLSAIGFAALYGHFEVFALKQLRLDPSNPAMRDVARWAYKENGTEVLRNLLEMGMAPNDQENGGCSAIQDLLQHMSWDFSSWRFGKDRRNIDTHEAREKMKAIHLLVRHGARWVPEDRSDTNDARKSLLKLTPDYTLEFVWLMTKYKACTKECVEALLRTPTMKAHTAKHSTRLAELVASWSGEPAAAAAP